MRFHSEERLARVDRARVEIVKSTIEAMEAFQHVHEPLINSDYCRNKWQERKEVFHLGSEV